MTWLVYMLQVFRRSGRVVLGDLGDICYMCSGRVVLGDLGDPTGAWSSGVRSSVLRTVSRIGLKLGGE